MSSVDRQFPMNTKAKRGLKLVKPAPLKRSALPRKSDSTVNSVVISANTDITEKVLPVSVTSMTSLDRPLPLNTKARRVGKLEKPSPLKRSLSANAGSEETLSNMTAVTTSAKTDNSADEQCAKKVVGVSETEVTNGPDKVDDASSGKCSKKIFCLPYLLSL